MFCDWASAADDDPRIKDDPAKGQYKEAYVVIHGEHAGKRAGRVPFIWVDSDLSLVRGLIQGFPKKLGEIHMTRPVELGRGGSRKAPGERFRGPRVGPRPSPRRPHRHDRRSTREDLPEGRRRAARAHAAVAEPRRRPAGGARAGAWQRSRGSRSAPSGTASAKLEFGASEHEEIDALAPVAVGDGWVLSMAFSVTGGSDRTAGACCQT